MEVRNGYGYWKVPESGGQMRLKWLFRAVVAVAALAPCLLGLQVALGPAASAATLATVSSVSPNSGPTSGGTNVVISGTGFTDATEVRFGGTFVPFSVVNDQEITATSPPGSGVVDVIVGTSAGDSMAGYLDWFTYESGVPAPAIGALFPSTGPTSGGTAVTITGTGFTGATSVTFGGIAASNITVVSDTQLTVTAPAGGPGPATVTVTTPGGSASTTSSNQYVYADTPVVSGISPSSGPNSGGTTVTISGSNFTGATAVSFRTIPATSFTVENDTTIIATAPPWTDGTFDVTVTNPAGTSAIVPADQYTYTAAAPVVTSLSPATGPAGGGTSVTITGTGFYNGTSVSFGSTVATRVSFASATSITAQAPAGTGVVDVTVTSPDGTSATSAADQFTYGGPPTATALFPGVGPTAGGTTVTVDGTGFVAGQTSVTIGGTVIPAASVTVQNANVLTFVTPANTAGFVSVTVTAPGGTSAAIPGGFNYQAPRNPVVTAVSPSSGSTAGGTSVTITGTGFNAVTAVSFGSMAATSFTVNSTTSITAVAPSGSAGIVDVRVTSRFFGTSPIGVADQFTYQTPAPVCTTTITGTHATQLTVSSGLTCLVDADQIGSVTVAAGASLSVTNSTVNGTVTATSPGAVTYCGSTEYGQLSVSASTGAVTLGDGGACAADKIPSTISIIGAAGSVTVNGLEENGTLTLSGDTGGVTLSTNSVNGRVYVENNAGPSVTVAGNAVTGSLYCTGNNPAPTDNGSINTVSGTATSQCAALAEG
jgi:hypothetical protein